jgi:hypothetical protein
VNWYGVYTDNSVYGLFFFMYLSYLRRDWLEEVKDSVGCFYIMPVFGYVINLKYLSENTSFFCNLGLMNLSLKVITLFNRR